jgi:hypothetical protein
MQNVLNLFSMGNSQITCENKGGTGLCPPRRCLPVELAAATRLTLLVLGEHNHSKLDVAASALPRSLQHLRLTEVLYWQNSHRKDDAALPLVTRDFGSMDRLHSLQLAAYSWAHHSLPLG